MIASFAAEEKWKSELVVAQAAMRDKAHVGLTTLLRQVGAVECRYESTAASARHFVCLQGAIALILAARSQDTRLAAPERLQAKTWLESLGTEAAVEAGLIGDWSTVALTYIRQDDRADPDPAVALRHKEDYLERVHNLFVRGQIVFQASSDDQTCFATAVQFAKAIPPIYYGCQVKVLWQEELAAESCARAMIHMKQVALEASGRLQAELEHSLIMDFACFDLALWQRSQEMLVGPNPDIEGHSVLTGNLWSRLSSLLRAGNKFDREHVGEAKEELSSVALMLLRDFRKARDRCGEGDADNREFWMRAASPSFASKFGRELRFLKEPIMWYLATEHAHSGPIAETTLDDALLAILDGPQIREDVVEKTDSNGFRMTAWSESFARLWLQLQGRRFCAYNRRHGPELPRAEKKGTDASIKRSQLRALRDLGRRLAGRRRPLLRDLLGDESQLEDTKAMQNFRKRTASRGEELRRSKHAAVFRATPRLPDPRSCVLFGNEPALRSRKPESFSQVFKACSGNVELHAGARLVPNLVEAMKQRALVIVGNVSAFQSALEVPLTLAVATAGLSVCNKTTYEANDDAVLIHFAKKKQVAYVSEKVLQDNPALAAVVEAGLEMGTLVMGQKPADKREADSVTVDSFWQARSVARQLLSVKRRTETVSMPGVALQDGRPTTKESLRAQLQRMFVSRP
ncbi:unnamed protein product [Symbiodinium sp. CCMP2592]|nr:unnamed protein product [Symbiodinium sp. CCMP2592]